MGLNKISVKQIFFKRQIINFICLFLCLFFIQLCFLQSSFAICNQLTEQDLVNGEAVLHQYVYDGDTIKLKDGRKIRLIGINTPEIGRRGKPSQAYAKKAKSELSRLLAQPLSVPQKIILVFDRDKKDKYKRTLAYVYLANGADIQASLLLSGFAMSIVVPPNDKNLNCYRHIEEHARNKKIGIWSQKKYAWFGAEDLYHKTKGYRFIHGSVTAVRKENKYIFLKLDHKLSIKLSKQAFLSYKNIKLQGQQLSVRGWVYPFKQMSGMTIDHPANIKITPPLFPHQ